MEVYVLEIEGADCPFVFVDEATALEYAQERLGEGWDETFGPWPQCVTVIDKELANKMMSELDDDDDDYEGGGGYAHDYTRPQYGPDDMPSGYKGST